MLTDGSGHGEHGRLASSRRLLARAGVSPGSVFGRLSDRDAYLMLMGGDLAGVTALVDELAGRLVGERVDYVAGDACEGFNAVHDLCRLILDAAVLVARRLGGRAIADFEFPLEAGPDWRGGGDELVCELDDAALARKLAAARDYPELSGEVDEALRVHGAEAFRHERLHRVEPLKTISGRFDGKPSYERFGEQRVAAGHYTQVLRHREHFAPLADRLIALVDPG